LKLLLDTHALLWYLTTPEKLPAEAHRAIRSAQNEVYASLASAWEISIKVALGKLTLPDPPAKWFPQALTELSVAPLPISAEHALAASSLPPHHRDPFDRLLIAQAQHEGLTLVTVDRVFQAYDVPLLFG
jgi:PIN domain nuclease of toxin-antitoxin system